MIIPEIGQMKITDEMAKGLLNKYYTSGALKDLTTAFQVVADMATREAAEECKSNAEVFKIAGFDDGHIALKLQAEQILSLIPEAE